MGVTSLKEYKISKNLVKDCKNIFKVIDLATRALTPYNKYKPVGTILTELKNNKSLLEAHLNTANKILKGDKIEKT